MQTDRSRVDLVATGTVVVVLGAVTVFALTLGVTYNWPDDYHADFGFPLVWGTHLTDSFAGPVDRWSVSLGNLGLDLVFWLAVLLVGLVVTRLAVTRRFSAPST